MIFFLICVRFGSVLERKTKKKTWENHEHERHNDARASWTSPSAQRNTHKQRSRRINCWQLHNLRQKKTHKNSQEERQKVLDLVFGRSVYLEHSNNAVYDETIALIAADWDGNLFGARTKWKCTQVLLLLFFFRSFLISCTLRLRWFRRKCFCFLCIPGIVVRQRSKRRFTSSCVSTCVSPHTSSGRMYYVFSTLITTAWRKQKTHKSYTAFPWSKTINSSKTATDFSVLDVLSDVLYTPFHFQCSQNIHTRTARSLNRNVNFTLKISRIGKGTFLLFNQKEIFIISSEAIEIDPLSQFMVIIF